MADDDDFDLDYFRHWYGSLWLAGKRGQFMEKLDALPRSRWLERGPREVTLLHIACLGDNLAAAAKLFSLGFDLNARDTNGWTPTHYAVRSKQPRLVELLCAAGANIRAASTVTGTPLQVALSECLPCAYVLVANGVRLSTVRHTHSIIAPLAAFERGVLLCRSVAVAFLGLKRRRGDAMRALDRWVVKDLCVCIWATRAHRQWQAVNDSSWATHLKLHWSEPH